MTKIAILGSGAWGCALAAVAAQKNDVIIWGRDDSIIDEINNDNTNQKYLPGIKLDKKIKATNSFEDLKDSNSILLAVPAQKLAQICKNLKQSNVNADIPLVICCKGIDIQTHQLMSQVVSQIMDNPIAILSGPNFAAEIASGLPAGATLACNDKKIAENIINELGGNFFRLYYSDDIIGAQIAGAVKNVLAIACGIAMGRKLGENARATLVTRGLAEISRLSEVMGGRSETLLGLSGIGDIMLTCGSVTSRNMALGYRLGGGAAMGDIISEKQTLTEGVSTAKSVSDLAKKLNVDMPISSAVNKIVNENSDIEKTISELLNRPLKTGE